ncbi:hypothetical protein NQZ68_002429 [Dissostichus eleginoides]|nr:hypothetical protein NQZ68_002429 [Dissostichus eleginoides]
MAAGGRRKGSAELMSTVERHRFNQTLHLCSHFHIYAGMTLQFHTASPDKDGIDPARCRPRAVSATHKSLHRKPSNHAASSPLNLDK